MNTVKVLLRAGAKTDAQDQVCKYSKATNPIGEREEKVRGRVGNKSLSCNKKKQKQRIKLHLSQTIITILSNALTLIT